VEVKQSRRVGNGEWSDFCFTVLPTQVIAFTAWPGEGCEKSNFGLCKYPAVMETSDGARKTKLSGWRWTSFCETQYASDPNCGGLPNCLKDLAGDGVQMPISLFPDFEKLEAAGQEKLPPALAQLAKLARQVTHAP
jgi:hypothetical protein